MDNAVELSVIIVNYQSGSLLRACIESVRAQRTSFGFEVVLVDNGSSDGSMEGIRCDARLRLISSPGNIGFGRACNIGAEAARGEWLLFLNPDTRLTDGNLEAMMGHLRANPDIAVAGAKILNDDGSFQTPCRRRLPTLWTAFRRLFLPRRFWRDRNDYELGDSDVERETSVDAVSGSYLWILKRRFQEIGGFDERFFLYGEDLDLCWRVKTAGGEVRYVPVATAIHSRGQSRANVAKRALIEAHRSMAIFYRKHYRARHGAAVYAFVIAGIWLRACAMLTVVTLCPRATAKVLAIGSPDKTRRSKAAEVKESDHCRRAKTSLDYEAKQLLP